MLAATAPMEPLVSDNPNPAPAPQSGGDNPDESAAKAEQATQAARPQPRLNINVAEDRKIGDYANFLVVTQSPHDFTLDFCQLLPSGDPSLVNAEVVSRVRIAPTMVARVIQALNTNLNAYEERWGNVRAIG